MTQVEQAMRRIVTGVAAGFGATARWTSASIFAPLVQPAAGYNAMPSTAELVGDDNVNRAQARRRPPRISPSCWKGARRLYQPWQRRMRAGTQSSCNFQ